MAQNYVNINPVKLLTLLIPIFLLNSCANLVVKYAGSSDIIREEIQYKDPEYKKVTNYIPDPGHPQASQIRYVRINFHIMQRSDGTGNFDEAAGRKFCRDMVDQSNFRWSNNHKMNLPVGNLTEVLPIGIRVVLEKDAETGQDAIYFHKNDSLCFWNRSLKKGYASLSDQTVLKKYGIGNDSVLNIFLMEHVPDSLNSPTYGGGTLSGISFGGSIKLFSMYLQSTMVKYRDDGSAFTHDAYFLSKLMNHELGHSFGLNHTWNWDDGCEDTPKNPGCWSETGKAPCDGVISNNMMDYNWSQQAVSPCQIGKMEYHFAKETDGARKYAIPYWCEYHPFDKVIITKNENIVWNGIKDLWGDIEIRNGATLTIKSIVSLPEQAKIIVKPGGKLIIDGGKITNRCGDKWDGIEIWRNKKTEEIGVVVIANNGIIEEVEHYEIIEVEDGNQ